MENNRSEAKPSEKKGGTFRKELVFVVLVMALLLVPVITMPVFGNEEAESDSAVKVFPKLMEKDGINKDFLSEAGDYFGDNFGLRQEFVDLNARLLAGVFGTSARDNVVTGSGGWLFYGSSLVDYQGIETLSDLQLAEIATNVKLLSDTLAEDGIKFVFTVAPNKNSLYPDAMPGRYKAGEATRNFTRLAPFLKDVKDFTYVDLYGHFKSLPDVYYHKTDSHWTNEGAAMGMGLLLDAAGKEHTDYAQEAYDVRDDFTGDLFGMLYPTEEGKESEVYYRREMTYTYTEPIKTTYDAKISTVNEKAEGSAVMFRDSFGNALLPFVADQYGEAFFSRAVPYEVYRAYTRGAETVYAEIVERNLNLLQRSAPVVPVKDQAAEISLPEASASAGFSAKADEKKFPDGDAVYHYVKLSGQIPEDLMQADTEVYAVLAGEETHCYPCFRVSEGAGEGAEASGFACYADMEEIRDGSYEVRVLVKNIDGTVMTESLAEYRKEESE